MASESKILNPELEEVNGEDLPEGDFDDNASDVSEGGMDMPDEDEKQKKMKQKKVEEEAKPVAEEAPKEDPKPIEEIKLVVKESKPVVEEVKPEESVKESVKEEEKTIEEPTKEEEKYVEKSTKEEAKLVEESVKEEVKPKEVSKEEAKPVEKEAPKEEAKVVAEVKPKETAKEEPKPVEEPAKEEIHVVEEVKPEEPVKEEAKPEEELVKEDKKAPKEEAKVIVEEVKPEDPAKEEIKPVAEEIKPVIEELKPEEPVKEEAKPEEELVKEDEKTVEEPTKEETKYVEESTKEEAKVVEESAKEDPEQEILYNTLSDTFNAFSDGSGQLGYPDYQEAWNFLNRPGDEKEMKATFDSVDVDGSCMINMSEFLLSLMGKSAMNFEVKPEEIAKEEATPVEKKATKEEAKPVEEEPKLVNEKSMEKEAAESSTKEEKKIKETTVEIKIESSETKAAEKNTTEKTKVHWTEEEDRVLIALGTIFPNNFEAIVKNLSIKYSPATIELRYKHLQNIKKSEEEIKQKIIMTEADKILLALENIFTGNYIAISKNVSGNHTPEEIESRLNQLLHLKNEEELKNKLSNATSEEDKMLLLLDSIFPQNFEMISLNMGGAHSAEELKNRYEELYQSEIKKIENLSEEDRTLLTLNRIFPKNNALISLNCAGHQTPEEIGLRVKELKQLEFEDNLSVISSEEDKTLLILERIFPQNFEVIAQNMGGTRSAEELKNQYEDLRGVHNKKETQSFDLLEQDRILVLLEGLFRENWDLIAKNTSGNQSAKELQIRFEQLEKKESATWTEEDDRTLLMLAQIYRDDWSSISRSMNHSAHNVERRYHELKELKSGEEKEINKIDAGWTTEQDNTLLMLEKIYKRNWETISENLHHFSPEEAKERFEFLITKTKKELILVETLYGIGELIDVNDEHAAVELKYGTVFCNEDMIFDIGQWEEKQDKLLLMLVGVLNGNWKAICRNVGHNEEQTETRYHLLMNLEKEKVELEKEKENYSQPSEEWTEEEDKSVKMLYSIYQDDWKAISRSVRHSPQQVEERYYRLTNTWTEEQDQNLMMLDSMLEGNWKVISRSIGHNEKEVEARYEYLTKMHNHDEAELDAKEAEDEANFEVEEIRVVDPAEYDSIIQEIIVILDEDNSGTIDVKELQSLYPNAADFILNRFDYDGSGDLDVGELKSFINSTELAKLTLAKVQGSKEENKVIWTEDQDRIILMLHKIYGDDWNALSRNVEQNPEEVEKRLFYLQNHAVSAKPKKRFPGVRPSINIEATTPGVPFDLETRISITAPPSVPTKRMPGIKHNVGIASALLVGQPKRGSSKRSPSVSVKNFKKAASSPTLSMGKVVCPYAKFGCTSKISEEKLANHEAVQAVYHLSLVQKAYQTLQEKHELKVQECDELQEQLNRQNMATVEN